MRQPRRSDSQRLNGNLDLDRGPNQPRPLAAHEGARTRRARHVAMPWRSVVDTFFSPRGTMAQDTCVGSLDPFAQHKVSLLRTGWRWGTHTHIHSLVLFKVQFKVGTTGRLFDVCFFGWSLIRPFLTSPFSPLILLFHCLTHAAIVGMLMLEFHH